MTAFGNDKILAEVRPQKDYPASKTTTLILLWPWGGRGWYASAPPRGHLSLSADVLARKGGSGHKASEQHTNGTTLSLTVVCREIGRLLHRA